MKPYQLIDALMPQFEREREAFLKEHFPREPLGSYLYNPRWHVDDRHLNGLKPELRTKNHESP